MSLASPKSSLKSAPNSCQVHFSFNVPDTTMPGRMPCKRKSSAATAKTTAPRAQPIQPPTESHRSYHAQVLTTFKEDSSPMAQPSHTSSALSSGVYRAPSPALSESDYYSCVSSQESLDAEDTDERQLISKRTELPIVTAATTKSAVCRESVNGLLSRSLPSQQAVARSGTIGDNGDASPNPGQDPMTVNDTVHTDPLTNRDKAEYCKYKVKYNGYAEHFQDIITKQNQLAGCASKLTAEGSTSPYSNSNATSIEPDTFIKGHPKIDFTFRPDIPRTFAQACNNHSDYELYASDTEDEFSHVEPQSHPPPPPITRAFQEKTSGGPQLGEAAKATALPVITKKNNPRDSCFGRVFGVQTNNAGRQLSGIALPEVDASSGERFKVMESYHAKLQQVERKIEELGHSIADGKYLQNQLQQKFADNEKDVKLYITASEHAVLGEVAFAKAEIKAAKKELNANQKALEEKINQLQSLKDSKAHQLHTEVERLRLATKRQETEASKAVDTVKQEWASERLKIGLVKSELGTKLTDVQSVQGRTTDCLSNVLTKLEGLSDLQAELKEQGKQRRDNSKAINDVLKKADQKMKIVQGGMKELTEKLLDAQKEISSMRPNLKSIEHKLSDQVQNGSQTQAAQQRSLDDLTNQTTAFSARCDAMESIQTQHSSLMTDMLYMVNQHDTANQVLRSEFEALRVEVQETNRQQGLRNDCFVTKTKVDQLQDQVEYLRQELEGRSYGSRAAAYSTVNVGILQSDGTIRGRVGKNRHGRGTSPSFG